MTIAVSGGIRGSGFVIELRLCVPKIRFCNIGGEGHRELVVI
jgi:hypothetical protein